jgi:hypothetical protein
MSFPSKFFLQRLFVLSTALACASQFAACSLSGPLREDVKASGFRFEKIPNSWIPVKAEAASADLLFREKVGDAMIATNSLCYRYETTSLERLAHQFESGLKDTVTLTEDEKSIDGRTALRVHMKGTYDGVLSEVLVVVLRKNNCIFDMSLVGVSPLSPKVIADFDEWTQGFRYTNREESSK